MNKVDTEYTFKIALPEIGAEIRVWIFADKYSDESLNGHIKAALAVIDEYLASNDTVIPNLAKAVLELVDFSAVEVINTFKTQTQAQGENTTHAIVARAGIVLYKNWSTTE